VAKNGALKVGGPVRPNTFVSIKPALST